MMDHNTIEAIVTLGTAGLFVTIGKILLANDEKLDWSVVIGKVILGTALAISAAAILALLPTINTLALVGISCAISLLGLTWFEELAKKYAEKFIEKK